MQCPRVDTVEESHFESCFKDILVSISEGIPSLEDGKIERRWREGGKGRGKEGRRKRERKGGREREGEGGGEGGEGEGGERRGGRGRGGMRHCLSCMPCLCRFP